MKPFKNREQAGKILATRLEKMTLANACVLALPRGGVPIAWQIANALNLPWDVLLVKKIGAPDQPELAIGAICEDAAPFWSDASTAMLGLSPRELQQLADQAQMQLHERAQSWRPARKPLKLKSRTVILVDDGLATGLTMHAAVQFVKRQKATKIIVAVPIASRSAADGLRSAVDELVVLHIPEPFYSVGQWYDDFTQVTDEMVRDLLQGNIEAAETATTVRIAAQKAHLLGDLIVPVNPKGVVIFAHGSGSSRQSPRNQTVAQALNQIGFATLLIDLLTPAEAGRRANVFNIELLSERLQFATRWVRNYSSISHLPIGYFGASTGAAAALVAAAKDPQISAVVSRGGRPDMAETALPQVRCPVLLIVGGADTEVMALNQQAKMHLSHAEIVIVPGAGHLFEEPGALDAVIEYAGDWFNKTLSATAIELKITPRELVFDSIDQLAHPIDSKKRLAAFVQRLGKSRIVMLGEATHGTEEFYQMRKVISQRLIEDHGFNFIAVEGDWPDCYQLHQYAQGSIGGSAKQVVSNFKRWPTWMWANEQVVDLIEWMKGRGAGFFGLDVYSFYESLDRVASYAKKLDARLARRLLEGYACLDSFARDEIAYAKSLATFPAGCEKEIVGNLREILRLRLEQTALDQQELFDMQQNAKIVDHAEKYYRSMFLGGVDSWNIRDEHMMDTLEALLRHYGANAKAIVWAHNTHIGDYHATDMVEDGYINLGGLARERYGMEQVALVGFGTYSGHVLAARAWGASPEIMQLPAAPTNSYEGYLHRACQELKTSQFYMWMAGNAVLNLNRGHRAVGVVYQPNLERHGKNYVPTQLADRYDAFVFIDKTSALKALPTQLASGLLPEAWPSAV